jgi:hypothetical protein
MYKEQVKKTKGKYESVEEFLQAKASKASERLKNVDLSILNKIPQNA